MKRFACLVACMVMLAAGTGCCWHRPGCGGGGFYGAGYGGCPGGNCGYGAVGPGAYYTGTTMQAGVPAYTANAPIYAPTTAYAPVNPLPAY